MEGVVDGTLVYTENSFPEILWSSLVMCNSSKQVLWDFASNQCKPSTYTAFLAYQKGGG